MYRFIGFLLRSSLQPVDSGGYAAYFTGTNLKVDVNKEHTVEIPGTSGFMADLPEKYRMTMNRFKQIRGAYHPEDRELGNSTDDKCYQLRYTINELNAASAANFIPEGNLSFDEGMSSRAVKFVLYWLSLTLSSSYVAGGIRCRSRFCPVRMYNKDKPDKFRVDFFILAGSDSYIIHHLDVYQGKNACNVSVDESCWNLPTTMKAVVNAVIKCQLKNGSNDVNGYRVISLDNRYQCPQLAYLLWTR